MPTDTTRAMEAYLQELRESRERYLDEAVPALAERARSRGYRMPPREFRDTSFLHIRSQAGDTGARPLVGGVHWHSPDIQLYPAHAFPGPGSHTNELVAGRSYRIVVQIHNGGDLAVPYPKLELFLSDPTLGFDTRFSTHIATTQHEGILLPGSSGLVQHTYRVPHTESGHKCLFARLWSFSPPDLPIDLHALDPRIDQRVAQQNLHIVGQGQPYAFQIVHQPNAADLIELVALERDELLRLPLPALANHRVREDSGRERELLRRVEIMTLGEGRGRLEPDRTGFRFTSEGDGPRLEEQFALLRDLTATLSGTRMEHGAAGARERYRALRTAWRKMNLSNTRTQLAMRVPDLGLQPGEAAAFSIVCRSEGTGTVRGGITLVVTGSDSS